MAQVCLDNIYDEIVLLPEIERGILYDRMKRDFYQNSEIVAYSANNEPLTIEQYKHRVKTGVEQCMDGQSIDLETLTTELGYSYADL